MLMTRGELQPGENVVVNASGSGIGHAAVQIAKLAGATVIATAGSDDKLERSRADGADHVVNYRNEDLTARVLDMTDGRGVDLVIEHIGGELFGASLNALRKNGRLVTCGGHAGEVVPLDIIPVFRNEWRVIGSRTGTVPESELVMGLITEGKLVPRIHARLPLAEAAEAQRIIEEREQFGKVLLIP
jgi:NADPH:quinone reductase-like Zn-dependent oxidoreductase